MKGYTSPCATCPFLCANHGKPNPPGVASLRAKGVEDLQDWFSTPNIRRIWVGIQDGDPMLCHSSDPKAETYGGKSAKPGVERMCVGSLLLLKRHLDFLGRSKSLKDYKHKAGRDAFDEFGLGEWAWRILTTSVPAPDPEAPVGVPWEAPVTNGKII